MTRRALLGLVSTVLFSTCLVSGAARAAEVWTNVGPDSYVSALATDPKTAYALYAVAVDRVFKSTDSGGTWGISGDIGIRAYYFSALAIDPSTPSTLYVGTNNCCLIGSDSGLSKSTDGGASWARIGTSLYVNTLAIDPLTPSTLYAGGFGSSVFRSTDAGSTWTAGMGPTQATALVIDPSRPSTIYAGTSGGGIYKSTDSGGNWAPASTGLTNLSVQALVVNPLNPSTLYAGTNGGIFRSGDAGDTWSAINAGLTAPVVNALVIDPRNPARLYAGTAGGLFRSFDSGESWTAVGGGVSDPIDTNIRALALNPAGTLYAAFYSTKGVWRMTLSPAGTFLLPASAHCAGPNGAFYTTDLTIANRGAADATLTIQFLGHDADGSTGPVSTRQLAGGRSVTHADVLGSLFGVTSGYGAIRVTSDSAFLKITGVTSTPPPDGRGSVGQSVPAFTDAMYATPGTPRSLVGLREDAAFRTNLVLANADGIPVHVELSLVGADGVTSGAAALDLPPLGMTQVPFVVTALGGAPGTRDAVLVVTPTTAAARVAAYASVIDNLTNDPRTVLP